MDKLGTTNFPTNPDFYGINPITPSYVWVIKKHRMPMNIPHSTGFTGFFRSHGLSESRLRSSGMFSEESMVGMGWVWVGYGLGMGWAWLV
jgi:membrane peptidoglycan carboxypeptidase